MGTGPARPYQFTSRCDARTDLQQKWSALDECPLCIRRLVSPGLVQRHRTPARHPTRPRGGPRRLPDRGRASVAALEDVCPHRLAPLSLGTLRGNAVECGYHGLTFDCSGQCVAAPGMARPPTSAQVRSFPDRREHGHGLGLDGRRGQGRSQPGLPPAASTTTPPTAWWKAMRSRCSPTT